MAKPMLNFKEALRSATRRGRREEPPGKLAVRLAEESLARHTNLGKRDGRS